MSRNSSRIRPPSEPIPPETPKTDKFVQSEPNPFGISFVVPVNIVDIPSGGEFYDEGSTMFNRKSVEIKQMTAREEEILSNPDFIKDGTMLDRLIDSILVDKSIDINDMYVSDKNGIIIEARKNSYGPNYAVKDFCTACGTEQEFVFDLNKTKVSEKAELDGVTFDDVEKTYNFDLPSSKISVRVKVLSPKEEEYLVKQKERAEKLNIKSSDTLNFLRAVVVEANGVEDQTLLNKLFEVLPVLDIRMIKKVSNMAIPVLNTSQEVSCGGCGHVAEREVPFSLGFFWPEL